MTLGLILVLVFVITVGMAVAIFYFMIEEPSERRRMRERLRGLEQVTVSGAGGADSDRLLRDSVLSSSPAFNEILLKIPVAVKLHTWLRQADVKMTAAQLLLISAGLCIPPVVVGLTMHLPVLMTAALTCFAVSVPTGILIIKRQRRMRKFDEQFCDAIDLLARAVRAGHAFTTGLDLIARELSAPIAEEFQTVYDQQNLGLSLRDALSNLAVRMPLPDVRIFVTALRVQRESGGNLAEILDNLATVIRERFTLLRQVRTVTAEGRMSLYALTALPFAVAVLMLISSPDYLMEFIQEPLGQRMIGGALVLQVIGYAIISKIVRIKV